ncbi:TonB-dependent receptor domain-containing protein [Microbulbifer sp. 2205BS26-8]|uniref:TonB-dependent receptor domain-containing protein n=1 Tax=Microbulbifer sp. 2205BS26-8 TaxID=3064386 RepID=UPI00273E3307|nr:TonB-dependent receptor [Microbulbifer sp. 2205BS26-8]MDP5210351.1 TonB-dependent receptor [Microbulbifer sp. 2205BS26-8]
MEHNFKKSFLSLAIAGSISLISYQGIAQENEEGLTETDVAAEEDYSSNGADNSDVKESEVEEVVVTGSRIARDTFSSISPLQIIDTEGTREAGVIDASSILQNSQAASGQQIDLTFSGYVLDNGPGSSTVSLRGLGANRTLVLVNGRRLAPAGVGGAPTAPDLNLIPSTLVQQYDLLLDGASSIYGSDAVAGVTNVILKKDFDGFDFEFFSDNPTQGNGEENTFSLSWGKNFDRGFIGMGAEYYESAAVTLDDRDWTSGCQQNVEVGTDGKISKADAFYTNRFGMDWRGGCTVGSLVGRVSVPSSGSIYYTPGQSNGGWNGFSESSLFDIGVDGDGDGRTDISFLDYSLNGREGFAHLFPEQDRASFMAFGEYTFEGEMNLTPFFETLYSKRNTFINTGASQLFPSVPADNPYNICNPDGVNGVDCGLAYDALLTNPNYIEDFIARYGAPPSAFDLEVGSLGAQGTQPIVAVRGDRNRTDVSLESFRFVTGLRGDLPMLNIGSLSDWSFDTYFSFSKSDGRLTTRGIRDDRLNHSLNTTREDPNNPGSYICGDGSDGCVPVNLFADSLYQGVIGDFATQAERDYLFGARNFRTEYYQKILSGFVSGKIASLPAGDVSLVLGAEFRNDRIKSIPNDVARDGLLFGYTQDGGATGHKDTREVYGEIEIPLLGGMFLAEELTANLSTRYTDDEYYGDDLTESVKIGYRPINSLLLRATYGTSYRAPNLRENFLKGQTGFLDVSDPCVVPEDALGGLGGSGYDPSLDTRAPEVLANCLANGVDPTQLENGSTTVYNSEVTRRGLLDLEPETSESYTVGFSWEQPFFDAFGLTLGMTYYKIDIENAIVEPSAQFLINDCYGSVNPSAFCSLVQRDADGFINNINAEFLNQDQEVSRGFDYNIRYEQPVTVFGAPIELSALVNINRTLERSVTFIGDDGTVDFDEFKGEFGNAEWIGNSQLRVAYDDFRFTWSSRYVGAVEQDEAGVDVFSDIYDTLDTGVESDTCIGSENGGVECRDVGYADDYWVHSASLYYYADTWFAGIGVNNVFNEAPPEVDGSEVLSVNNAPIGAGYDLQGRTVFVNLQKKF